MPVGRKNRFALRHVLIPLHRRWFDIRRVCEIVTYAAYVNTHTLRM
jgi:hypothetical protein